MKFQLIHKNEYGESQVQATSDELEVVIKKGRDLVTEDNMANAYTLADKLNDWENYMVEVLDDKGEATNEAVYGGEFRGVPFVYHFKDNKITKVSLDTVTVPMRFYIGTDNGKAYHAGVASTKNVGKYDKVTDLKHQALEGKGTYYVNIIE